MLFTCHPLDRPAKANSCGEVAAVDQSADADTDNITATGDDDAADTADTQQQQQQQHDDTDTDYHPVSPAVRAFVTRQLARVKSSFDKLLSFTVRPDHPLKGPNAGALDGFCIGPVHFWAPHRFYPGLPSQPPCPEHGFAAVYSGSVVSDGWLTDIRRVTGLDADEYLVGTGHRCSLCKKHKAALLAEAAACTGTAEQKSALLAAAKAASFCYRSYDSRVTQHYASTYPWVAELSPAIVCSNRTAVTPQLAKLIKRTCVAGGNPTDLANMLSEAKAERFDSLRLMYYSYHKWMRSQERRNNAPSLLNIGNTKQRVQLSMQESLLRGSSAVEHSADSDSASAASDAHTDTGPELLTAEAYGFSTVSSQLVRRFFVQTQLDEQQYQFQFRQQHVWAETIQADHTLKVSRGMHCLNVKMYKNRLTIWSSETNCPMLCVNTDTTSYDDGAVVLACRDLQSVWATQARGPISSAYIDNPGRDAKGLMRRFTSLEPSLEQQQSTTTTANMGSQSGLESSAAVGASNTDNSSLADDTVRSSIDDSGTVTLQELAELDDQDSSAISSMLATVAESMPAMQCDSADSTDLNDDDADIEIDEDRADLPSSQSAQSTPNDVDLNIAILQAAEAYTRYFATLVNQPAVQLPAALSRADRKCIHALAEALGLAHVSIGHGDERCIQISSKVNAAAQKKPAKQRTAKHWKRDKVKYDPRHW